MNRFPRKSTIFLEVEQLEDRTTPSATPVPTLAFTNVSATPSVTNGFIVDLYNDVLFRNPGADSLPIINALNGKQLSGGGAFASLIQSPEFQAVVEPILNLYQGYLGRPADAAGLNGWARNERSGLPLGVIATSFLRSAESVAANGNVMSLPDVPFVSFLYQKLLNRAPDPVGLAGWVTNLRLGLSRGNVLLDFLNSPEFAAKHPLQPTQNQVTMAYDGLWKRSPDGQFDAFVNSFSTTTTLGNTFIQNAHYLGIGATRNYLIGLYEGLLGREPDINSYEYFRTLMVNLQLTDAQVYDIFIHSSEFLNSAGLRPLDTAINRTFVALLGRLPTPEEFNAELAAVASGMPVAGIVTSVMNSSEYLENGYQQNIKHTVVLFQENWSFDSLLGTAYTVVPGLNGLQNASATSLQQLTLQVSPSGQTSLGAPYALLPAASPDVPGPVPNGPYNLAAPPNGLPGVPPDQTTVNDPTHRFYQEQLQINGGQMNGFVAYDFGYSDPSSSSNSMPLSYYDSTQLPYGTLLGQSAVNDNFFHSGFGGSYFNAFFLVAAAAPPYTGTPNPADVSALNGNTLATTLVSPGVVQFTNDSYLTVKNGVYYAINDLAPAGMSLGSTPTLPTINDNNPAGPLYTSNIGDLLNSQNVSWAWYAVDWKKAVQTNQLIQAGVSPNTAKAITGLSPEFIIYHQPFTYFANYQPGTALANQHLQDYTDFTAAVANGQLPQVVFLKSLDDEDEHPASSPEITSPMPPSDVGSSGQGQNWAVNQITLLQNSSSWVDSSVIVTYDENGGRWDHVSPPPTAADGWGPGSRVPSLIVSPFARRGAIHTQYETVSIDATLEKVYNLGHLTARDAAANPLFGSYTFSPTDLLRNNQ